MPLNLIFIKNSEYINSLLKLYPDLKNEYNNLLNLETQRSKYKNNENEIYNIERITILINEKRNLFKSLLIKSIKKYLITLLNKMDTMAYEIKDLEKIIKQQPYDQINYLILIC